MRLEPLEQWLKSGTWRWRATVGIWAWVKTTPMKTRTIYRTNTGSSDEINRATLEPPGLHALADLDLYYCVDEDGDGLPDRILNH